MLKIHILYKNIYGLNIILMDDYLCQFRLLISRCFDVHSLSNVD